MKAELTYRDLYRSQLLVLLYLPLPYKRDQDVTIASCCTHLLQWSPCTQLEGSTVGCGDYRQDHDETKPAQTTAFGNSAGESLIVSEAAFRSAT